MLPSLPADADEAVEAAEELDADEQEPGVEGVVCNMARPAEWAVDEVVNMLRVCTWL